MENIYSKKYFAASNSAEGFVNYFPQIFSRQCCSRVYVIKGGPGTGKSRFMREVANEAEGRGLTVKYYYCSSDAESLDGVIIEELRLGILDGTAPHVYEPSLVGVREQIINFGDFWDERKLAEHLSEIEELSAKKSASYQKAYNLLAAYGKILLAEESLVYPCVNKKKLSGAVSRLLHKMPERNSPTEEIALCRAVGMNGKSKLDTYENNANMLFTVSDSYRASHFFINEIAKAARERKMSFAISYDPVMPTRADAICLCDAGVTFVTGDFGERKINIKRFIDESALKSDKEQIKRLESAAKNLESLIIESFETVKEYHFKLEKIYMSAMDFEKKERYTENFIKKIFK